MNNKNTFSTDSFQLASYLMYESAKLVTLDRTNPKRILFIFEASSDIKNSTEKFFTYQAKVEPNKFATAQKNLKQMIYQQQV